MSDEPQPPVVEEEPIIVTAPKLVYDPGPAVPVPLLNFAVYTPPSAPDIFAQHGGLVSPTTAGFEMIGGNVVVTLPGYDFKLKIPAAEWERMSKDERGAFIKVMNEFDQSPKFKEALDHLQNHGVAEVVIHYDTKRHLLDGSRQAFSADEEGFIAYEIERPPEGQSADDTNVAVGSRVVVTINSSIVNGSSKFATVLMHELRHPVVPGTDEGEEAQLKHDEGIMYDDIFRGDNERSVRDYFEGQTFIGSMYDDNATGSTASDTLSGLSGNDTLDGAAGDDLVMGGAGMDRLSGGTGTNYVLGGLDADTYVPAAGVTLEQIGELGGVDRLDLSRFMLGDAVFSRDGNMLIIRLFGATVEEVVIEEQWLAEGKIEQFVFADGTYAASYIEYLADTSGGTGVCYEDGQPVICGPYGMPVVLDLDGDGIELIDVSRSRARFDIDGDGAKERIGWVGGDDGILALDRNGNGRIDDFSEISFLQDFLGAGSDLEGLMAYDTNGDGSLTAADDRFGEFLVWRDRNGNGRSEKNELFTLEELGIVSIGLERGDLAPLDLGADANQLLATSVFRTVDGRPHMVGDVALFVQSGDCGCDTVRFEELSLQPHGWVP